jgi:tetratricopeptide (TPR) repeat protein
MRPFLPCLVCLGLLSTFAAAQEASPPPKPSADEIAAKAQLAGHFVEAAQALLPPANQPLSHGVLLQTAALLKGAMRLNPSEPRYPRLLAEAQASIGDVDGQIASWTAYRKLVPDDRVAQAQIIDLYISRFETADKRLEYINQLLDNAALAPEVKAHIAAMAVPLLDQRSHDQALAMLARARQFALLPEVARLQYMMLPQDAQPQKRAQALLDMILSNPAQADAIIELAKLLSSQGLPRQGASWYAVAFNLYLRAGITPQHSSMVEYLCDLFESGQGQVAGQGIDRMLQADPNDADAWFIKLSLSDPKPNLEAARTAFTNRLGMIASRITSAQKSATTMPASAPTTEPVDPQHVSAVSAKLKQPDDPSLRDAWVSALADLSWFELYYANQPQAAVQWIDALKLVVATDNETLARSQGWEDLLSGRLDEAEKELSPIADRDALAELGMIRLAEQRKQTPQAAERAEKLASQPHAGVLGAIIFSALADKHLPPTTEPSESALADLVDKFPMDWLNVLVAPNRFYQLSMDPVQVAHHLGEPMMAQVTIRNIGKQDLNIGSGVDGLIQPQLWFDAAIRGIAQQAFPGIAADHIMSRFVLHPQDSITQIVRIDQRELGESLRQLPIGMISVEADVVTNPIPGGRQVLSTPGGYPMRMSKIFSQHNEPLSSDVTLGRFIDTMQGAAPAEKMLDLQLLAAYVRQYSAEANDPKVKTMANQYMDLIARERADTAPEVSNWANYLAASVLQGPAEQQVIEQMVSAKAPWESRVLGVAAARLLSRDQEKKIAEGLENDSDPIVKDFATATVEAISQAATQPTTQPAVTQPTQPGA